MAVLVGDRETPSGALVRTLTLSRPERRNALDPEHLQLLSRAVDDAVAHGRIRALVVTGEGPAFCAGYDLGVPFVEGSTAPDALVVSTMAALRACPLPTVARVHGPAFGAGLELAISCDVRLAGPDAKFCLPPAKLGIAYAPAGLARLVSLVGTSRARLMTFSARVLPATTAAAWGLVDEVLGADELDANVDALADTMADLAPLAIRAMKKTLNRLEPALDAVQLDDAERDRLACYASDDAADGVRAFAGKRAPRFSGR